MQWDAEVRDRALGLVEDFGRGLPMLAYKEAYESLLVSAAALSPLAWHAGWLAGSDEQQQTAPAANTVLDDELTRRLACWRFYVLCLC